MADKIMLAIKPKYPTRRAVDKVLTNSEEFVDVVEIDVARQAMSLLYTSNIAIYKDDKYYPVNIDNVAEQYDLLEAGEELTVEEDDSFGVKKLEYFLSVPEDIEELDKIQDKVQIYNGIISGKLIKVEDYSTLGIEDIDKNGFWLAIKIDKSGAEAEGYSEIKLFGEEEELKDGVNYIYMGATNEDVVSKPITILASYQAPDSESSDEGGDGGSGGEDGGEGTGGN